MTPRRPIRSLDARARSLLGYAGLLARGLGGGRPTEEERRLIVGYPRNHRYRLCRGRAIPVFRLHDRLEAVETLYPDPLESFLDLGCCRGYFVLQAARRPSCRLAVGVDVHEPFVSIARRVGRHLQLPNAAFHPASLTEVSDNPRAFGGPFQVVLTLGTYHYLYWGSECYPSGYAGHREILGRLSRICADRLILSGRLEVGRLPRSLRGQAATSDRAACYTQAHLLEAAAEYFEVAVAGHLGRDALFMMTKRVGDGSGPADSGGGRPTAA